MSYIKLSGEPVGDGGDQYTGFDRFGRVVDNRWMNSSNVDIGAFGGSWGCVPDEPAPPSPGNYYPTPNNYGNGYNPTYSPYTGDPTTGRLPSQL